MIIIIIIMIRLHTRIAAPKEIFFFEEFVTFPSSSHLSHDACFLQNTTKSHYQSCLSFFPWKNIFFFKKKSNGNVYNNVYVIYLKTTKSKHDFWIISWRTTTKFLFLLCLTLEDIYFISLLHVWMLYKGVKSFAYEIVWKNI